MFVLYIVIKGKTTRNISIMQINKREKSPIKSRILQYLEYKGISEYVFYKESGVARSTLKQDTGISEDNITKFLDYARDISPLWILTGKGQMLIDNKEDINPFSENNKKNISSENVRPSDPFQMSVQDSEMSVQSVHPTEKNETIYFDNSIQLHSPVLKPFPAVFDKRLERQQVPLYDMDASAGIVPILDGSSTPIDYISIPDLPKCDGAVNVRGDSMYPLIKSGDIVLFKNINDFNYIIWGEMYLVSFCHDEEEFCVIKYVQKSEKSNKIKLVSYNEHHNSIEIYRDEIRALAIIKASIRYNTMM